MTSTTFFVIGAILIMGGLVPLSFLCYEIVRYAKKPECTFKYIRFSAYILLTILVYGTGIISIGHSVDILKDESCKKPNKKEILHIPTTAIKFP